MAAPTASAAPGIAARLQALPSRNRVALMVALAAGIAAIVAALLWARTPDYRVLFSNVSDRDGGAIVQALGQMNVPYRLAEGGGAILVPAGKVHEVRLRLASLGLPRGGTVGFELMENAKFGTTQFQEQVNYQRALEGELARSIQSLASVSSARVHLAIPKPSVFLRDAQKPTASVLVNLHSGQTLDRGQISGIVHLVASSVPELPVKSVSVVDQSGALLSGEATTRAGLQLDPTQLAYVAAIEQGYAKRIQDILEPIVGRQNVRAQVTADIDFSESEATAESYRPNHKPEEAAVRSQQVHESVNGGGNTVGGVPGALTNQPAPAATAPIGASPQAGGSATTGTAATSGAASTRKESTVNYEVDKTVRHTRASVGAVRRLSAAVVVNHRRLEVAADAPPATGAKADKAAAAKAAAAPKFEPLPAEEMAKIAALAKEAMGYSQNRGDTLEVVNAAFAGAEVEAAAEVPMWRDPRNVALAQDLGKPIGAALIVVALLLAVVRPAMRTLATTAAATAALPPPQIEVISSTAHPGGYESNLANAKQLARKDPKVVANVVRQWVSGDE